MLQKNTWAWQRAFLSSRCPGKSAFHPVALHEGHALAESSGEKSLQETRCYNIYRKTFTEAVHLLDWRKTDEITTALCLSGIPWPSASPGEPHLPAQLQS